MKKFNVKMLAIGLLFCLVLLFNSCAREETPSSDHEHTHQYEQGICKIGGEIDPDAEIDFSIFTFALQDDDTYGVRLNEDIFVTHVRIPAALQASRYRTV